MSFGPVLKDWRQRRRMSQLDLALGADVSSRHISFLETGRSKPSRAMVLRLAGELDVPHDARNGWLVAAGLAPAFPHRELDAEESRAAREALEWMLARHEPYPGMAIDRHWNIVRMNGVATRLLETFAIREGDSILDAFMDSQALQAAIQNIDEVAAHTRERLVADSAGFGGETVLDAAIVRMDALFGRAAIAHGPLPAFVPVHYQLGDMMLSLFSTFSHFATAQDVALSELRIELMFPADEASRRILTDS